MMAVEVARFNYSEMDDSLVNFFMEFDICFFRSQAAFELIPKQV